MTTQPRELDLQELENRLRPGGFSQQGFLGPSERLVDVIARDGAKLSQLAVTYEVLASCLEGLIVKGEQNRGRWIRAGPKVFIHVVVWKGFQICPWTVDPRQGQCTEGGGVRFASIDWRIRNKRFGSEVRGPGLIVHLIRDHHFFEGLESPNRVDPEALCELLQLGGASARDRER